MKKKEAEKKKGKKKRKGPSISTIILFIILLAGVGILLYPSISDWWNSMHATKAIAGYVTAVEDLSAQEREDAIKAAQAYNTKLLNGVDFDLTEEEYAEYEKMLDIGGTGIMGYVQISAIGVNLPVYHSVDESVLQIAVGHIPGSSLPVGGERTHSVLSGHRGLPSAKLFSDLDRMVEGDILHGGPDSHRPAGGDRRACHTARKGLLYIGHLYPLWRQHPPDAGAGQAHREYRR